MFKNFCQILKVELVIKLKKKIYLKVLSKIRDHQTSNKWGWHEFVTEITRTENQFSDVKTEKNNIRTSDEKNQTTTQHMDNMEIVVRIVISDFTDFKTKSGPFSKNI